MRHLLVFSLCAIAPHPAPAQDWQALSGPQIVTALSARVLRYSDPEGKQPGTIEQDFFADGRTLFDDLWGYWWVWDDHYCSKWPQHPRPTCYRVAQSGLDIRFDAVNDTGSITGRYVDLN